jgi:DNA-binding MarR family transcriptional regulator
LEQFERRYFATLLAYPGTTLSQLARATGLDPSYLQRILKRLGLHQPARPRER